MTIEQTLNERSGSQCELCSSKDELAVYTISGAADNEPTADNSLLICCTCQQQIDNQESMDINHWRCLNDSMWSPVPAVQVMAWRLLTRLSAEGWPQLLPRLIIHHQDTTYQANPETSLLHLNELASAMP